MDNTFKAYSKSEADKIQRILDEGDISYEMIRKVSHDQRDGKMVQTEFKFDTASVMRAIIKKL